MTDAELEAVFGRRTRYYIAQWRGTATSSANWAAFFFWAGWLAYRRLYVAAVLGAFWLLGAVLGVWEG